MQKFETILFVCLEKRYKASELVLSIPLFLFKLKGFVLSKVLHSVARHTPMKARHIQHNSYRNKINNCNTEDSHCRSVKNTGLRRD